MKEIASDRDSLADQVYDELRDAIILGELAPGSLHSVYQLADQLKVSRTPVREALIKLADQGMVKFERNRGIRILMTTGHDLEEIFSLRMLLEVPATYRATEQFTTKDEAQLRRALDAFDQLGQKGHHTRLTHLKCDANFHRVILLAAGNRRLADFVDTLRDLQQVRGVSTVGISRDLREVYRDHEVIFERIKERDSAGAAAAMRDHIAITARLLLAQEAGNVESASRFDLSWLDYSRELPGEESHRM